MLEPLHRGRVEHAGDAPTSTNEPLALNRDGSGLRPAAPAYSGDQCVAAWSADGKRIIFGGLSPALSGKTAPLRIVEIESGQVTAIPGTDGLWSPNSASDGSRLLALTLSESGRQRLAVQDPASGRWKQMSEETAFFPFAVWAPDKKSVIYYSIGEIRRLHMDSGRAEAVASFDRFRAIRNLRREWVGLDHGGAILVMRNLDVRQIYEIESVSR